MEGPSKPASFLPSPDAIQNEDPSDSVSISPEMALNKMMEYINPIDIALRRKLDNQSENPYAKLPDDFDYQNLPESCYRSLEKFYPQSYKVFLVYLRHIILIF